MENANELSQAPPSSPVAPPTAEKPSPALGLGKGKPQSVSEMRELLEAANEVEVSQSTTETTDKPSSPTPTPSADPPKKKSKTAKKPTPASATDNKPASEKKPKKKSTPKAAKKPGKVQAKKVVCDCNPDDALDEMPDEAEEDPEVFFDQHQSQSLE